MKNPGSIPGIRLLLRLAPLLVFPQAQAKPNLLFIVSDQVRFDALGRAQDSLGVAAKSRIQTPNLDRLSKDGAWFRNAYTHCAVCGPARTSFLTGRTLSHTGVANNGLADDTALKSADPGAAQRLATYRTYDHILVKDEGYQAEFYGKWHSPQTLGWVYDNDLRSASGGSDWYGKLNPDASRHYSLGLSNAYLDTLDTHKIGPTQIGAGQLQNGFTKRAYIPDPLDARYGNPASGSSSQPESHGMDLLPEPWSLTAVEGREAIEALDRLGRGNRPFSLSVSFHSPHAPMVPTAKYYKLYNPADMPVPRSIGDSMDNSAYRGANGMGNRPEYRDPVKVKRWTADYYGLVTEVDEWVGAIFAKLQAMGLDKNTLVVFLSDHGEMLGAHGLREKNIFYEESARVPMIFWMPGKIPAGTVVGQPVTSLDLRATVLDYLGLDPARYPSDGKSLRPLIERKTPEDPYVVTQWDPATTSAPVFMIREGDWKLMLPNKASSKLVDMLYDLKHDPYELNNLLGKNAATAADAVVGKAERLKLLMSERLRQLGDPLLGEVENRRTWKTARLWVSDTAIDLGAVPAGGTRQARLFLGSTAGADVAVSGISIIGDAAGRFGLDWTKGIVAAGGSQSVKIAYHDTGSGPKSADIRLVINHDAGGPAREVRLTVTSLVPDAVTVPGNAPSIRRAMGFRYSHGTLSPVGLENRNWTVAFFTPQGGRVAAYRGKGESGIPAVLPSGLLALHWEASGGLVGNGMLVIADAARTGLRGL